MNACALPFLSGFPASCSGSETSRIVYAGLHAQGKPIDSNILVGAVALLAHIFPSGLGLPTYSNIFGTHSVGAGLALSASAHAGRHRCQNVSVLGLAGEPDGLRQSDWVSIRALMTVCAG
jgi:hypothetical protein